MFKKICSFFLGTQNRMHQPSEKNKGTLYIVSTPIGNLEDITLRALRILREVDLVAAEDTRHTQKLLSAYGIQTPMTSLFEWNEKSKSGRIISKLKEGKNVAYVSDAGTPGVSDPGFVLIKETIGAGITIVPIPGASASLAALSISGLPMDSFVFYAFLPHTGGKKRRFLESLREEKRTMIFYESPRRVLATLQMIRDIFGEGRQIVVARELTKIHEEVIRGSVGEAIEILAEREIKGEITILLGGGEGSHHPCENDDIKTMYCELHKDPALTTRDIVASIATQTGLPKKEVYKKVLELQKNEL